jgi:hypothetical protein
MAGALENGSSTFLLGRFVHNTHLDQHAIAFFGGIFAEAAEEHREAFSGFP